MGRINIYNNSYSFGSGEKSLSGSNRTLDVWAGCSLGVVLPRVHEPFCRRDKGGHPPVFSQGISNLVGQAWMSHLTRSHSYWWSSVQLFFGPSQAEVIFP